MKVFFDHQVFDAQRFGGASRLFAEVIARAGDRFDPLLGVSSTRNEYLLAMGLGGPRAADPRMERAESLPRAIIRRVLGRPPVLRRVNELPSKNRDYGISLMRERGADLIVPTFYDGYVFEVAGERPVVPVVLDLIPERFPEFFLVNERHSIWKRRMAERAPRLVAISEAVRADLELFWGIDPAQVTVAPLASSFLGNEASGSEPPVPPPYLLYVGSRGGYKNFYFLVESLLPFFAAHREWTLACVGAAFSSEEERFFSERGLSGRVRSLQGDDTVGSAAYRHCTAVVVPSQAEGFGLPVLEAFSFGKPVVASRIPVFEEVGSGLIEFFDPKDPWDLRSAVERAVAGGGGADAAEARRVRARDFSWERTADAFAGAFREVLR